MTKRDMQAAEYAAEKREQCRRVSEWIRQQFYKEDGTLISQVEHNERFAESLREEIKRHRAEWDRFLRRDTLGIRVHRAVSKWVRYVWLRFVGH